MKGEIWVQRIFVVQFIASTPVFGSLCALQQHLSPGVQVIFANLTIEIPLKAITRGYTYEVLPIAWRNRAAGTSSLLLKEQGSRYLFVLLSVWFEWLLVRHDYRRPSSDSFSPWRDDENTAHKGKG